MAPHVERPPQPQREENGNYHLRKPMTCPLPPSPISPQTAAPTALCRKRTSTRPDATAQTPSGRLSSDLSDLRTPTAARGQRGKPQLAGGLPHGDRDLMALKMLPSPRTEMKLQPRKLRAKRGLGGRGLRETPARIRKGRALEQ